MSNSTAPVAVTVVSTKKPLNEKSLTRLAYEQNALATKLARKAHLEATGKTSSKAYLACVESIAKTEKLIQEVSDKMNARIAKAAAKVQPSNDVTPQASDAVTAA